MSQYQSFLRTCQTSRQENSWYRYGTKKAFVTSYFALPKICSKNLDVQLRDCNPGLVFLVPGFKIEDFTIPGPCQDYGISPRIWD